MHNRYRVLLVGCGSISDVWLESCRSEYADRLVLTGFCDINIAAAKEKARKFSGHDAWVGNSLIEGIALTKPDIVFNCTVPEAHCEVSTIAMRAGCHVLTEKPLANSHAEGREILETARVCKRRCAVMQNYRYFAGAIHAKDVLDSNIIGQVHTLNVDFYLGPHFGGFREHMEHPLLSDMAIHTFDLARFLSGRNAANVLCHEFNPKGSWYKSGASAMAIFTFSEGVVFNYRASWCADGARNTWSGGWRFIGVNGTALWDGDRIVDVESIDQSKRTEFFSETEKKRFKLPEAKVPRSGHAGVIGAFLEGLDFDKDSPTNVGDNFNSLAMALGAIQSAELASWVKIQEAVRIQPVDHGQGNLRDPGPLSRHGRSIQ